MRPISRAAATAATGRTLWEFDPGVSKDKGVQACCDVVNRGVAAWKGRLYVGTIDGRLIALNAETGKPDWSVQTTDNSKPDTITGARGISIRPRRWMPRRRSASTSGRIWAMRCIRATPRW